MANLPTINVVLRPFKDQQGKQALNLRITHQRKSIFKTLGIKVLAAKMYKHFTNCIQKREQILL